MRGKAGSWNILASVYGITPAYAGKSRTCWRKSRGIWDHPRLCGEKSSTRVLYLTIPGSPPPMRGKAGFLQVPTVGRRITPAYAGKSRGSKPPKPCIKGSPPPMRGKDAEPKGTDQKFRITPAYAGKSGYRNFVAVDARDHPRLCGEKSGSGTAVSRRSGSPPPMRGKGNEVVAYVVTDRITPAYAGKSRFNRRYGK